MGELSFSIVTFILVSLPLATMSIEDDLERVVTRIFAPFFFAITVALLAVMMFMLSGAVMLMSLPPAMFTFCPALMLVVFTAPMFTLLPALTFAFPEAVAATFLATIDASPSDTTRASFADT